MYFVILDHTKSYNLLDDEFIKILESNAGAIGCGVIVGAKVPIAITSRSDSSTQSYLSLAACSALLDKYAEEY